MDQGAVSSDKVALFMQLAGHGQETRPDLASDELRVLGAHLLLSEVLEFVIKGLGVTPHIGDTPISDPEGIRYKATHPVDTTMMLDGLADVGYTMWWNALAFGMPLARAYELVCKNNLEKFVLLGPWARGRTELPPEEWHCHLGIRWPDDVVTVAVIAVNGESYAVGKDAKGKVRKPSSYRSVDLTELLATPE